MPVILDSAASNQIYILNASSGGVGWTHNVNPSATNVVAFVALLYTGQNSPSGATWTVKFGGVTMTQIGQTNWTNSTCILYSLTNPTPGANAVTIGFTGMPTSIITNNLMGVSETVANVASVGTVVSTTPSNTVTNTVTAASQYAADRVLFCHAVGFGWGFTGYNQSLRASSALFGGGQIILGDAPGATSVVSTAPMTNTNSGWAAFAVPMTPTPVYGAFSGPQFGIEQPAFRGGIYRVSTPPTWRVWPVADTQGDQAPFRADQDAQAVLDYGLDFTNWLAPSDTLISVSFTVDSTDVRIISQECSDTMAVVWLDFPSTPAVQNVGQLNTYNVTCHATSLGGRQDDRTFQLRCRAA